MADKIHEAGKKFLGNPEGTQEHKTAEKTLTDTLVDKREIPPDRTDAYDYLTKPDAQRTEQGEKTVDRFNKSNDPLNKEIRGEVAKRRGKK